MLLLVSVLRSAALCRRWVWTVSSGAPRPLPDCPSRFPCAVDRRFGAATRPDLLPAASVPVSGSCQGDGVHQ
ncbi:hypothetical protein GUJ93_ZPchr0006g41967 [Zizania palustris]|uniref:Uncharacterized protein n=1 Tax=Zizania palustris TaxID=103762 RepID=A0A8J5SJV1_ZIZPA|nr:hypothetical protein GUJ93_ZPchr0006g41967 [Zizania palustris]